MQSEAIRGNQRHTQKRSEALEVLKDTREHS
jgi:hypothetical protein